MDEAAKLSQNTGTRWLTEGFLLAGIPLVAYFIVLSYETARCITLGIPTSLIEVTPVMVFRLGMVLLMLGSLLAFVHIGPDSLYANSIGWGLLVRIGKWSLELRLASPAPGPMTTSFAALGMGAVVYVLASSLQPDERVLQTVLVAAPLLVMAWVDWRERRNIDSPAIAQRSRIACVVASFLLLGFFAMGWLARGDVLTQKEYAVVPGSPEKVILAWYGRTAVCAPLDRTKHQFVPEFQVLKVDETEGLRFRIESIGPLTSATPPPGGKK